MTTLPHKIVTHAPHLLVAPAPRPQTGLGDVVAKVAEPVAAAMDKLTGSKLVGCQPCAQRRDTLNRFIPNILKPLSR